jgi:tRNA(Arg) A34 adenosine deaminase TadA
MALMLAQKTCNSFDLSAANLPAMELVTSAQPCIQCFGNTWWSGVTRLVIGANVEAVEKLGFNEGPLPENWRALLENRTPPLKPIEVLTDVLSNEACKVLEDYKKKGGQIYNAGSSI